MRGIFVFLQYVLFVSCDEVAEDSVCFNKCSGHGTCKDFSCDCFPGWAGEDCNVRLTREEVVVPILSAGHINVTINTIHSTIQSYKHLVIGFSSLHCRACFAVEAEYKKLAEYLAEKNVMFARANADEMKSMCSKLGVRNLPALVVFHSKLPHLYRGVHSYEHFKRYIEKTVIEPPLKVLETIESVNQFKTFTAINEGAQINSVHVIGFFSDAKVTEEDEYEEFKELAQSLQSSEEIYFAVVARSNVSAYFKTKKLIDRTPSLLVITAEGFEDTISFDEIELKEGIREWIEAKTVPLVGRLEENNFIFYEKLNRPMLLLFLDLSNESHANQVGIIGGRSGGLLNEALLQEFRATAKEYVGSISFVFLDGNLYADKMKSLGLLGGVEGLPSMAFNTKDGSQIVFPESLPFNFETMNYFCASFLSGKLSSAAASQDFAKKALQRSTTDLKYSAMRSSRKKFVDLKTGTSEDFDAAYDHKGIVQVATQQNFEVVVMEDGVDVLLLLHAQSCEPCAHLVPYFKKMAERLKDLKLSTLRIARMDVTHQTPPPHLHLLGVGNLPTLILLPANAKHEPWNYYSGVGKPQDMMIWVQKLVNHQFELPNLPHLTGPERELYKAQIKEREAYMDELVSSNEVEL